MSTKDLLVHEAQRRFSQKVAELKTHAIALVDVYERVLTSTPIAKGVRVMILNMLADGIKLHERVDAVLEHEKAVLKAALLLRYPSPEVRGAFQCI